jgi:hypothetical protein
MATRAASFGLMALQGRARMRNGRFLLRARAALLLGSGLVLAGLASVLYLLAAPLLPVLPELPSAWLMPLEADRLQLRLGFTVVGVVVMALGAGIAIRQIAVLSAEKRRREDALRRVQQYRKQDSPSRKEDGRLEPFIGSHIGTGRDADASLQKAHSATFPPRGLRRTARG